jgi:hypothetical protein
MMRRSWRSVQVTTRLASLFIGETSATTTGPEQQRHQRRMDSLRKELEEQEAIVNLYKCGIRPSCRSNDANTEA